MPSTLTAEVKKLRKFFWNQHIREKKAPLHKIHKKRKVEKHKVLLLPAVTVGQQLSAWEDVLLEKPQSSAWGGATQTPGAIGEGGCFGLHVCLAWDLQNTE